MYIRSNIHTHTSWSDGKDSVDAVVSSAVQKGFHTIGISDHNYLTNGEDWCMLPGLQTKYVADLRRCAEKYSDEIDVLVGLEYDYLGEPPETKYDYLIGSLHALMIHGTQYDVDDSPARFQVLLDACGGNSLELAKRYYDCLAEHTIKVKPDVLGHFDLITKFSMVEYSDQYWYCAEAALQAALPAVKAVEINTGAMVRGWRTDPYPADPLLRMLRECDFPVILSSDSHAAAHIDYAFNETLERLRRLGFARVTELTKKGFVTTAI